LTTLPTPLPTLGPTPDSLTVTPSSLRIEGTCGSGFIGNGICPDSSNNCCSPWGWCGISTKHCNTTSSGPTNPVQTTPGLSCGNATVCLSRPTQISMKFNGGDCSQSTDGQDLRYLFCEDYGNITPVITNKYYIVAVDIKRGIQYFRGYVELKDNFLLRDGSSLMKANMNVTVYVSDKALPEEILQTIVFHTSCSQNLYLNDIFGSIQVVGFKNDEQNITSSCINTPTVSPTPTPVLITPMPTERNTNTLCGNESIGVCPDGQCCSPWGYCGTGYNYCGVETPNPTPNPATPRPTAGGTIEGTCVNGNIGDGICSDGTCCSKYGWCGITPEHCGDSSPLVTEIPPTPQPMPDPTLDSLTPSTTIQQPQGPTPVSFTISPTPQPTLGPTSGPAQNLLTPSPKIDSLTALPTPRPTLGPTSGPTLGSTPDASTILPTSEPTLGPTLGPTPGPISDSSTTHPTPQPTLGSTQVPTFKTSPGPTLFPTPFPTPFPTRLQSTLPSIPTSPSPSFLHSDVPSSFPSYSPSKVASRNPTNTPSAFSSDIPSPFLSLHPSNSPSDVRSSLPSIFFSNIPSPSPSLRLSKSPSKSPSSSPTIFRSTTPSSALSLRPSYHPSKSPSSSPTIFPSKMPSPSPSKNPSSNPSKSLINEGSNSPSQPPSQNTSSDTPSISLPPPCLKLDATTYNSGDPIAIHFDFEDAYNDDWIGIYTCDTNIYYHAFIWQWSCGNARCTNPVTNGKIIFDSLPYYNNFGPHEWPIIPTINKSTGDINQCFQAVYLRNDGPSVPPYTVLCESNEFTIFENDTT